MKSRLYVLLASSSILAIASTMAAHAADIAAKGLPLQQQLAAADDSSGTEEIIVTARRKAENLLDVPETVNAVTGAELQKFNITQFQDITKVIAGITIQPQTGFGGGSGSSRGLQFGPGAGPTSLVMYINDAAIDQTVAYQALYDIGDIESLSGPQGVNRGKLSDTGAILITTHRPDLEKFGGYGEVSHGSLRSTNLQAAVGVPLIQDKLGLRIAAIYDDNASNNIESVTNQAKPDRLKEGARATARFAPTDDIDTVVSFEHMRQRERDYTGGGSGNNIYYGPGNAAGGPPLTVNQYKTLEPGIANDGANFNDFEGTLNWTFVGQKLTAVTGWNKYTFASGTDGNPTDQIPGVAFLNYTHTIDKEFNQDIRLSSAEPLLHGYLDYVVGFFYDHHTVYVNTPNTLGYLPGAFTGGVINPADIIQIPTIAPQDQNERAYYGSATVHITKNDEITGGIRYGAEQHNIKSITIGGNPIGPPDIATYHPVIYNIEASHHFNDDLMVYLRTASTWRYGVVNIVDLLTLTGAPVTPPSPTAAGFQALIYPLNPETSKDYEVGVKGAAFDKRLSYSVDYGHQVYSNFIGYTSPSIYHLTTAVGQLAAQYSTLGIQGVPAKVDFIEAKVDARITKQWSASGNIGWAKGSVSGALPCNPPGITAASTQAQALAALGNTIYFTCTGQNAVTVNAPRWSANLSSEYDQPINDTMQGFVRGLFNYHPSNPYTGNPAYVAPAYGVLDLYLGLRQSDSAWEVSFYGKNIFNNQTMLSTSVVQPPSQNPRATVGFSLAGLGYSGANSAGYSAATLVSQREFGVTVHYAFGAR